MYHIFEKHPNQRNNYQELWSGKVGDQESEGYHKYGKSYLRSFSKGQYQEVHNRQCFWGSDGRTESVYQSINNSNVSHPIILIKGEHLDNFFIQDKIYMAQFD